jgi:hypothetical protein
MFVVVTSFQNVLSYSLLCLLSRYLQVYGRLPQVVLSVFLLVYDKVKELQTGP